MINRSLHLDVWSDVNTFIINIIQSTDPKGALAYRLLWYR